MAKLSVPEVQSRHCESYQVAVELLGKRWNGAIVAVLLPGPLRYHQLAMAVPGVSERLLSERLKELESEGVLERRVYEAIGDWARQWIETGRIRPGAGRR